MLTQEQKNAILSLGGFFEPQWIGDKEELERLVDTVYAAGTAAGEAKERELLLRCQSHMNKLILDEESAATSQDLDEAIEINRAIKAQVKQTK